MALAAFMATLPGRFIRVVAGTVLAAIGIVVIGGLIGWIVAAIGVMFIALAAFNMCLIALLLGAPFSGREALARRRRATP